MNRIDLLASLTKGSTIVCDVGCDHSYVLIDSIKKYGVKKGIAADIADGPLQIAKRNIADANLSDKISIIQSSGFDKIDEEFDTCIIAGMGGSLIVDLLSAGYEKIKNKKLILQANNARYKVRKFLMEHGFTISEEYSLFDQNKYYEMIVAIPQSITYTELDLQYGPILRRNQTVEFQNHYNGLALNYKAALSSIEDERKKNELINKIKEIEFVMNQTNEKNYICNTENYYTSYFIDEQTRPTIVVSAGGGYQYTSPRESKPVADVFNAFGYHVVVVNYRETKTEPYPMPSKYLAYVLNTVKKDARVSKIIGMGFSAGGHNMLEVALHHNQYDGDVCPDLLILGYPVVTSHERYWHEGSFRNLLLDQFDDQKLRSYLSLEKQVSHDAPDLFLWGTITDESVDVMNSLLLVEAYHKLGLNVEYHLFPMGGHGLSVCNESSGEGNPEKINPYIAKWTMLADGWIRKKLNL